MALEMQLGNCLREESKMIVGIYMLEAHDRSEL